MVEIEREKFEIDQGAALERAKNFLIIQDGGGGADLAVTNRVGKWGWLGHVQYVVQLKCVCRKAV